MNHLVPCSLVLAGYTRRRARSRGYPNHHPPASSAQVAVLRTSTPVAACPAAPASCRLHPASSQPGSSTPFSSVLVESPVIINAARICIARLTILIVAIPVQTQTLSHQGCSRLYHCCLPPPDLSSSSSPWLPAVCLNSSAPLDPPRHPSHTVVATALIGYLPYLRLVSLDQLKIGISW